MAPPRWLRGEPDGHGRVIVTLIMASELSHWHTPPDHSGAVAMLGGQIATITLHA
ncbi:hypothetical protein ACF05W_32615 [Streptomyces lydicus]|uniref:hypothetical protein n=1 Tax=Streptomyces lydicus TaxID=47763 RepID=UPI0036F68B3F